MNRANDLIIATERLRVAVHIIERDILPLFERTAETCPTCGTPRFRNPTQYQFSYKVIGVIERLNNIAAEIERRVATKNEDFGL
jgi:hypothetical protein